MKGFKKSDIKFHDGKPAINVKVYGFGDLELIQRTFDVSESQAQQALELCWDQHQQDFWETAQNVAEQYFGNKVTAEASGRSGGWLELHGTYEVEDWDGIMVNKWALFHKDIIWQVKHLTSDETIIDTIRNNEYHLMSIDREVAATA